MILIGLGANLPSAAGPPQATLEAALDALAAAGVIILARSRWYRTAPVPVSDQPWFVNGVASVATSLPPAALLAVLGKIELQFGRQRGEPNAARTLDLDIIDYNGIVLNQPDLILPHPRLQDRAFVLLPLAEVAPQWRHMGLRKSVRSLIYRLPEGQKAEPIGS